MFLFLAKKGPSSSLLSQARIKSRQMEEAMPGQEMAKQAPSFLLWTEGKARVRVELIFFYHRP